MARTKASIHLKSQKYLKLEINQAESEYTYTKGMIELTVRTYSVKKSGDDRLSSNFRVKEFASHDGADTVLIDDDLVYILQRIRDRFQRPVTISSGYRTPT